MTNTYRSEAALVARQAYARWHRDPGAPSLGSFDRAYWGWKYRDYSDATLQFAVRLAVAHARTTGRTSTLPALLEQFVDYCGRIQRRDGSFNQCYPCERAPGVVYDLLSTLIDVRRSPYLTSDRARRTLDGVMRRAVAFAMQVDEHHGEIANHVAEYAWELLNYAAYAGDERARARGGEYLRRLLELFDAGEGWFQEYDGPDPGYQTRTLRFLVKLACLLDRPDLWQVAAQAARFLDAVLMPDGSAHPMLGSRSTALVYPSGFEILAARDPSFGSLASRVRSAWEEGRVPLPSWLDFDNAIRLADDALEAAEVAAGAPAPAASVPASGAASAVLEFPNAGISVHREADRAVYVGHRLGGVVVVYGRGADGRWTLAYEDSGYVLRADDARAIWVTRMPGKGQREMLTPDRVYVRTAFHRSLHDELTPLRLVVLRVLNLTLLRVQWIADAFRRAVVRRLMTSRAPAPVTLVREIAIYPRQITVSDQIVDDRGRLSAARRGSLYRCRRVTGTHMASARYFQEQELMGLPLDWMQEVPWTEGPETRHVQTIDVASG